MKFLENKIPPPIVTLLFAANIWLISSYTSNAASLIGPYNLWLAIGLFVLGLSIAIAGVISFRAAATTVNPLKPESASSLVTSGVFRYSRNPMYVGLTMLLLAWIFYLAVAWGLLVLILFMLYIHRYQIVPEERAMYALFGDEFTDYASRVRRWL